MKRVGFLLTMTFSVFFASSVRAEEYSDSGSWGPDAPIEPEAEETPKEAVKEEEEEEKKEEPKAEANNEAPKPAAKEKEDAEKETDEVQEPKAAEPAPALSDEVPTTAVELPLEGGPAPSKPAPPSAYEKEWEIVESNIFDEIIPFEKRIALLKKFMAAHPGNHPHKKEAEYYLSQLEQHKETGVYFELDTTEWFGVRALGGSHGLGFLFSFFTLRWRFPYWTIFRIAGATGLNWDRNDAVFLIGGTQFGLQFPLDKRNAHLIRVGTGLMMGVWWKGEILEPEAATNGPIWDFEISYSRQFFWHLLFETGLELFVPTIGYCIDGDGETTTRCLVSPALMGFAGLRF